MENKEQKKGIFDSLIKKIILIIPPWVEPNHITFFRLFLVFVLILLFWLQYFLFAFFVFIVASLSDAVDGTLARQRKLITKVGSALDPLVDKFLIIVLIILLARHLPWQLVEILIISELATIGGAYALHKNKKKIKANIFGKLKMNAEILGLILLFIKLIYNVQVFNEIIVVIFSLVIFFSVVSFLKNLKDA